MKKTLKKSEVYEEGFRNGLKDALKVIQEAMDPWNPEDRRPQINQQLRELNRSIEFFEKEVGQVPLKSLTLWWRLTLESVQKMAKELNRMYGDEENPKPFREIGDDFLQ